MRTTGVEQVLANVGLFLSHHCNKSVKFYDRHWDSDEALGTIETAEEFFSYLQSMCRSLDFIQSVSTKPRNQTAVSEFLLLELTEDPSLQLLLFSLFLLVYLVTVLGNLLIILAIRSDPDLHTPMNFFLSDLSITDICMSTSTIPKMLVNIQAQNRGIS
ncbi:Olfactory receptor 7G2 [Sciurus carolinensis]|uniref:Olfactory receptor 7G2 n=1 Tax=Sciurus carolinensis TaxID=30640 RepID=A0AA41N1S7_SCICA|nr:Olfactory receptor 7G2 [Sciurus carolinensis]